MAHAHGVLFSGVDQFTPDLELTIQNAHAKIAESGGQWVRQDFWWHSAEASDNVFTWEDYCDIVVDSAVAHDLHLIPIVWGVPAWAAVGGVAPNGIPIQASWEHFLDVMVARYKDRVHHWEIWNEPDTTFYWNHTPGEYKSMLEQAYNAIKAEDSRAEVWLGGLALGGGDVPNFLEDILALGAASFFDRFGHHTNFTTMAAMAASIATNRALVPGKPYVVTESSYTSYTGWQVVPGYEDGQAGLARYITDAFEVLRVAGVSVGIWAGLDDAPDDPGNPYANNGLYDVTYVPKLAQPAFLASANDWASRGTMLTGSATPGRRYRLDAFDGRSVLSSAQPPRTMHQARMRRVA